VGNNEGTNGKILCPHYISSTIYNADFVLLERNPAFGQMDDNITTTSIGPKKICPSERNCSRQQQRTKQEISAPIMCSSAKQYKPQYSRNKKTPRQHFVQMKQNITAIMT
jgi:hypothetical protein